MARIVLTNGVFDILHSGHINTLVKCRTFAGKTGTVIVALDSDFGNVKKKGSNRPYFSLKERSDNILALKYPLDCLELQLVDMVCVFNDNDELYKLIKVHKPDIIVKSNQWKNNVVGADLAEVVYTDVYPDISTTKIEQRILSKQINNQLHKFDPTV